MILKTDNTFEIVTKTEKLQIEVMLKKYLDNVAEMSFEIMMVIMMI